VPQLKDPSRLFNSSLEGNARRAIDLHEGDEVDDSAFKALVRDAVALNTSARRGQSEELGGSYGRGAGEGDVSISGLTSPDGDPS
jgi:hypothetical protein